MQVRPPKLDYKTPENPGRSAGTMLWDVVVGGAMVVAGGAVCVIALLIDPRKWWIPGVWDRGLDLVPNGLLRIFRGRSAPKDTYRDYFA
jgi:hypothetical protein